MKSCNKEVWKRRHYQYVKGRSEIVHSRVRFQFLSPVKLGKKRRQEIA
jgi:hypothetical protein